MKFTIAALITLSAAVMAMPPAHSCQSAVQTTITITYTAPGTKYTPPGGDYDKPQDHPGSNPPPYTTHPGSGTWGAPQPPKTAGPDVPAVTTCTYTNWVGEGKPPATVTTAITNTATVTGTQTHYIPPPAKTHNVKVGGKTDNGTAILKYDPPVVYGAVGDVIRYDFLFKNHTLTESTFENPCSAKDGGFKSGFKPNDNNTPDTNVFEVTIQDDKPHWAYCGQKEPVNHCAKGMVHAINPPKEGNTFEKFLEKAKSSDNSTAPMPPSGGNGKTHWVQVGGFAPGTKTPMLEYAAEDGKPFVNAKPGDVIKFDMRALQHTVTRSSLEKPCEGIDGPDAFRTGVQMNPEDQPKLIVKDFVVPEGDKPIWFYCGVADHCQKGMVFAVNPGYKFSEFLENAKNSPVKPGVSGTGSTGAASSTSAAPTSTSAPGGGYMTAYGY